MLFLTRDFSIFFNTVLRYSRDLNLIKRPGLELPVDKFAALDCQLLH